MSTYDTGGDEPDWPAVREEAVAVLSDALTWNLPAVRWDHVSAVVDDIAAAVAVASPDAVGRTVERLELYSPLRVLTRLGEVTAQPAPLVMRERIAELIDALVAAEDQSGDPDRIGLP